MSGLRCPTVHRLLDATDHQKRVEEARCAGRVPSCRVATLRPVLVFIEHRQHVTCQRCQYSSARAPSQARSRRSNFAERIRDGAADDTIRAIAWTQGENERPYARSSADIAEPPETQVIPRGHGARTRRDEAHGLRVVGRGWKSADRKPFTCPGILGEAHLRGERSIWELAVLRSSDEGKVPVERAAQDIRQGSWTRRAF